LREAKGKKEKRETPTVVRATFLTSNGGDALRWASLFSLLLE
jgi:hypothetical protein